MDGRGRVVGYGQGRLMEGRVGCCYRYPSFNELDHELGRPHRSMGLPTGEEEMEEMLRKEYGEGG